MGWAMLIGFALLATVLLVLTGFPRRLWPVAATALTLGAAGYAWQGMPALEGHPVVHEERRGEVDEDVVAMREAMFGRFNFESGYFAAADAMVRSGSTEDAANVMLGAVLKAPGDAALWTGLGMALAANDTSMVPPAQREAAEMPLPLSPAARFAFDRAITLAPQHPGPYYFLGLTYVQLHQYAEARQYWARAVELTPEKMSYRPVLAERLALLDRLLGVPAGEGQEPAPSPTASPAPEPTP